MTPNVFQAMMAAGSSSNLQVISVVRTTNTSNVNLRTIALANGWDGTSPLDFTYTINSGVVVGGSGGNDAITTGSTAFPSGSTIRLVNNGSILGYGGAGGSGGSVIGDVATSFPGESGGDGGVGLRAQLPLVVTNNGTLAGGGGGGGGGSSGWGSGRGGSGGGGGGGRGGTVSSGGSAGLSSGNSVQNSTGSGGGDGNSSVAGAGGAGGLTSGKTGDGGDGGSGGGLGTSGDSGSTGTAAVSSAVGSGGAAGAAVVGNSNITWVATGTRLGAIT